MNLSNIINKIQLTKASGSDINTGTDDAKFVTSKAIADSDLTTKSYVDAGKQAKVDSRISATNITTNSTTMSQIGSCQVSITTKGGLIVIDSHVRVACSGASTNFYLNVDVGGSLSGTQLAYLAPVANETYTYVYKNVLSLAAGSHTIKLMWKVDSGITLTIPAYNHYQLLAFEV